MRHIKFIINKAFKNKFGNLYFLRFIYNNFKNKNFIGYNNFLNNVWGEKWVYVNINKVLKFLKQMKNVKSKSTNVSYVKYLAFGTASFQFLLVSKFIILSYIVQQHVLKSFFIFNIISNVNNRILYKSDILKLETLQNFFNFEET